MATVPRVSDLNKPCVPTGWVWNELADQAALGSTLTVGQGLRLEITGNRACLSLCLDDLVVPCVLTAPDAAGGSYQGTQIIGSANLLGGTGISALNLPQVGQSSPTGTTQLLIYNPMENGGTGHAMSPTNFASQGGIYGAALITGATSENPLRRVGLWLTTQELLVPVILAKTGGTNGGTASVATYLYAATNVVTGLPIGTNIAYLGQRELGKVKTATEGIVFLGAGTNRGIICFDEVRDYALVDLVTNVTCVAGTVSVTTDQFLMLQ